MLFSNALHGYIEDCNTTDCLENPLPISSWNPLTRRIESDYNNAPAIVGIAVTADRVKVVSGITANNKQG